MARSGASLWASAMGAGRHERFVKDRARGIEVAEKLGKKDIEAINNQMHIERAKAAADARYCEHKHPLS